MKLSQRLACVGIFVLGVLICLLPTLCAWLQMQCAGLFPPKTYLFSSPELNGCLTATGVLTGMLLGLTALVLFICYFIEIEG
jgi:hypothetical protein